LMHRFPLEPIEGQKNMTQEAQEKISEYYTPDGKLYVPGICVHRSLIGAGAYTKHKGQVTKSKIVAACVFVMPEHLFLGQDTYEIDSRAVVVQGARIVRCRPRFDEWALSFELEYDEVLISAVQMREIVDNAGKRMGLLDFRPERKGPYGRFQVVKWDGGG